jgi:hypothetical protein
MGGRREERERGKRRKIAEGGGVALFLSHTLFVAHKSVCWGTAKAVEREGEGERGIAKGGEAPVATARSRLIFLGTIFLKVC